MELVEKTDDGGFSSNVLFKYTVFSIVRQF